MPLINNYKKLELGRRMQVVKDLIDGIDESVKANAKTQLQAHKSALQAEAGKVSVSASEQSEIDVLISDIDKKITDYS